MTRNFKLIVALALLLPTAAFAKTDALSLVPNDAVTVGMVRLADLRTSPLSSMLFRHADNVSSHGEADRFLPDAGLQPSKDVDVLVVATSPRTNLGNEADVIVIAEGRFNVSRLTESLIERGAVRKNGYLLLPEHDRDDDGDRGAVAFPESGMVIAGTEQGVIEALAARTAGGTSFVSATPLGHDLGRIAPNASAWALVDVVRASRLTDRPRTPKRDHGFATAIKSVSTVGLWATDDGSALKVGAFGLAQDGETLSLIEDTVRGALATMRLAVQEKSPELVSVLRKFQVSRSDDSITITGSIPAESLKNVLVKKRGEHKH